MHLELLNSLQKTRVPRVPDVPPLENGSRTGFALGAHLEHGKCSTNVPRVPPPAHDESARPLEHAEHLPCSTKLHKNVPDECFKDGACEGVEHAEHVEHAKNSKSEKFAEPKAVSMPPKLATDGRAVVTYHLQDGKGGVLIDQDGAVSAVQVLRDTYGRRLDWADLLERFEERAAIMEHDGGLQRLEAEHMALRLIRQCMTV